jgi:hypothetical protein
MYSPVSAAHIAEGEDYLSTHYWTDTDVQRHIQRGSLVAFGTGSPGTFDLTFADGYPSEMTLRAAEFKLRLGIKVEGAVICVRDLYDLLNWTKRCPSQQALHVEDGYYCVTLCSDRPRSGVLGDNQCISVYLARSPVMPSLANIGVPTLCG